MSQNIKIALCTICSLLITLEAKSAPVARGVSLNGSQAASSLNTALASNLILQNQLEKVTDSTKNSKHIWATPYSRSALQNGKDDFGGFKEQSTGFAFGYDKKIANNFWLGAAVDIVKTSASVRLSAHADSVESNSYTISLYSKKIFEQNFELNTILSYGKDRYSSARASTGYLGANYDGWHSMFSTELLRNFKINEKHIISPLLQIYGAHTEIASYEESSSLNNSINYIQNQRESSLISSIGTKYQYKISGNESFVFKALGGYDSLVKQPAASNQNFAQPYTVTYGPKQGRTVLQGSASYENSLAENIKASLGYNYFERALSYKSHLISANLKISF